MAAIVRDRRRRQVSDPALETGPNRRTQLQDRLTVFGQVLLASMLSYWAATIALWSGEPGIGFGEAAAAILTIPNAVLCAAYAALWLATRGPVLSVRTLRALDIGVMLAFGVWWGFGWALAAMQPTSTLEFLGGIPLVLVLRGLIVPSSWQRTAVIGALTVI